MMIDVILYQPSIIHILFTKAMLLQISNCDVEMYISFHSIVNEQKKEYKRLAKPTLENLIH